MIEKEMVEIPIIKTPVIYYLMNEGIIVYVGISNGQIYGRLASHLKTKIFDKILYEECNKKELLKRETFQINRYLPIYNIKQINNVTENTKDFYNLLEDKMIRRKLVSAGFKQSTITLWKQRSRFPMFHNAQRLSNVLRIPIKSIPWTSVQGWKRNEP